MTTTLSAASVEPAVGGIVNLYRVKRGAATLARFTSGPVSGAAVVYDGQTYSPVPVELDAAYAAGGAARRPRLRVSALDAAVDPTSWHGAVLTLTRTLERYLDGASEADADRHWPAESWIVDRLERETVEEVVWELSSPIDLERSLLPGRQVLRDVCQWRYRTWDGSKWVYPTGNDVCPYTGAAYYTAADAGTLSAAADVCSRRLSGCQLRFPHPAPLPFGGFAGVGGAAVRRSTGVR